MEYYSAIKNEVLPFAASCMDKNITLSEVSQTEKDKYYISLICGKIIQMNLFTKQKQTHRHRRQTYGYQRGRGGKLGLWD